MYLHIFGYYTSATLEYFPHMGWYLLRLLGTDTHVYVPVYLRYIWLYIHSNLTMLSIHLSQEPLNR